VNYTGCLTTYQTRHFFNNSKTNEDIPTRFEQEYIHCVRNEEECVCSVYLFRCNIFIGVRIIKEMPGLVGSGTTYSMMHGSTNINYGWSLALCDTETWTLRKVDQNSLERFERWCWRRMEMIWTDRARNEEALHIFKQERNILHTKKRREANLDWSHLA
jgi:hypothetical protein